jgi:hypothetical protein
MAKVGFRMNAKVYQFSFLRMGFNLFYDRSKEKSEHSSAANPGIAQNMYI